jgi:hypothetical protein
LKPTQFLTEADITSYQSVCSNPSKLLCKKKWGSRSGLSGMPTPTGKGQTTVHWTACKTLYILMRKMNLASWYKHA